jgi:predicted kinase
LSPDEWLSCLSIDLYDEQKRSAVEKLRWNVAAHALALGVNVILEFGFWSYEERADYRRRGEALGARVELRFLAVPYDELWRRIEARNTTLPPGAAHIDKSSLDLWRSIFEPPRPDELV